MSTITTTPTTADRERARCCGSSVGARIRRWNGDHWEYLLIGRAWWPIGWAPIAGHVWDAHSDPVDAVKTEVLEEGGLTVVAVDLIDEFHLPNLCQAPPATPRPGHYWWIYDVEVTGTLRPDSVETTGARWVTAAELQCLADNTIEHALMGGRAAEQDPEVLEAVWVEIYDRTGDISANTADRVAVERLYSTPPDQEWIPTA